MNITQKKVKDYLEKKGWSIVTAAEKSGLPLPTIKSIIYGKSANQRITTLEKLAKAFDCNVGDLIGDNEDANSEKLDLELFKECLDTVESYLTRNNLEFSKDKTMKIIDSLFSLAFRKKKKNISYKADDETIDWIIDNVG
jgi:transcriptional regulator with XRE-family HTH domain